MAQIDESDEHSKNADSAIDESLALGSNMTGKRDRH
jgi:hypothetical protein